jgi:hypothetical protein
MSENEEQVFERGEVDPAEALKAHVEAQLGAALEKKRSQLEVTRGPFPNEWEVFAWGPWQGGFFPPDHDPGRIIFVGETAYIAIGVWMNDEMCPDIVNHEDKIELNVWTSNTQTMQPVPALSRTFCIPTEQDGSCFYVLIFTFTPDTPACLYETNICARICNCQGHTLPRYAGFVRHVYDFDPEKLWPSVPILPGPPGSSPTPGWGFDRPIRYMVVDRKADCC